ncbi:hypothetical protein LCGC14_3029350, partial [marine sediment metagenome]
MVDTLLNSFEPLIAAALRRGDIDGNQATTLRLRLDVTGRADDVVHSWISPATNDPEFEHFDFSSGEGEVLPHEAASFHTNTETEVPTATDTTIIFDGTASPANWTNGLTRDETIFDKIYVTGVPGKSVYFVSGHLSFQADVAGIRSIAVRTGSGAFI